MSGMSLLRSLPLSNPAITNHLVLGMLLTDFTASRYIIKEKAVGSESFKYRMGENAADEVGKDKIRAHIREVRRPLPGQTGASVQQPLISI